MARPTDLRPSSGCTRLSRLLRSSMTCMALKKRMPRGWRLESLRRQTGWCRWGSTMCGSGGSQQSPGVKRLRGRAASDR